MVYNILFDRKVLFLTLFFSLSGTFCFSQHIKKEVDDLNTQAIQFLSSHLDSAQHKSSLAYEKAKTANYYWGMARSEIIKGTVYHLEKDFLNSYVHHEKGLGYLYQADTLDFYNRYAAFNNIAAIHASYGNYQEADAYYDSALFTIKKYIQKHPILAAKYGDHQIVSTLLFYKARNLHKAKKPEEAIPILLPLLENPIKREENVQFQFQVLNQIGILYRHMQDYKVARSYFSKIINNQQASGLNKAKAYHNIGNTYLVNGELSKAEQHYEQAIKLKDLHQDKRILYISYLDLGEVYLKNKLYHEAADSFEQALNTYSQVHTEPELFTIYNFLSRAYARIDLAKSDYYSSLFKKSYESYAKLQREFKEKEKLRHFNLAVKQHHINEANKIEKNEIIKKYKNYFIIFVSISFIILFFTYKYTKKYQRISKYKKALKIIKPIKFD